MPRITISIPNDLQDRLHDPRVRKSVNISRICQKALRREVERILTLPIEVERMEQLIARLNREYEQTSDRWFMEGTQAARDWVEHEAPYALLRQLGKAPLSRKVQILKKHLPESLRGLIKRHQQEKEFVEESFLNGFAHMTGVLWQVIERNL